MNKGIPRLRMFAGPNGSGKSTFKSIIRPELLGIYINPDEIEDDSNTSIYWINAKAEPKERGLFENFFNFTCCRLLVDVTDTMNPKTASYFDKHGPIIEVDHLLRWCLRNI